MVSCPAIWWNATSSRYDTCQDAICKVKEEVDWTQECSWRPVHLFLHARWHLDWLWGGMLLALHMTHSRMAPVKGRHWLESVSVNPSQAGFYLVAIWLQPVKMPPVEDKEFELSPIQIPYPQQVPSWLSWGLYLDACGRGRSIGTVLRLLTPVKGRSWLSYPRCRRWSIWRKGKGKSFAFPPCCSISMDWLDTLLNGLAVCLSTSKRGCALLGEALTGSVPRRCAFWFRSRNV